jgi:hypothetical protein
MKVVPAFFAVTILVFSGEVSAQEQDKAKEHFFQSYAINPVPIVLYNIAYCYDELGEYADAVIHYKRFLYESKEAEISVDLKEKASQRMKDLGKFLGSLKLDVDEKGAEVIIDDKLAGTTPLETLLIETGEHDLLIRKTGFEDVKKRFTVVSGITSELSISMQDEQEQVQEQKQEKAQAQKQKKAAGKKKSRGKKLGPLPFGIVTGFTAAALAAAAVTGSLALVKDRKIGNMHELTDDWQSVREESRRLAWATNALIGVIAAGAVASIVLGIATDFKQERKTGAFLAPDLKNGSLLLGLRREF